MNLFNYFKRRRYSELLYAAFPKYLKDDLKVVLDIINIDEDFRSSQMGNYRVKDLISSTNTEHYINGEKIVIPNRIYFNEPSELKKELLAPLQHQILNCIFLLSANGYIREKNLKELSFEFLEWTVPYLILNLGGYVMEILIELDNKLTTSNIKIFSQYISENRGLWEKTKKRVVSYWNEYYRINNPYLKNYIGTKILKKIQLALSNCEQ